MQAAAAYRPISSAGSKKMRCDRGAWRQLTLFHSREMRPEDLARHGRRAWIVDLRFARSMRAIRRDSAGATQASVALNLPSLSAEGKLRHNLE
jgi:hypothetical protein